MQIASVVAKLVHLLLEDEEAGAPEAAPPALRVVLNEPAVIAGLAARHRDEDAPADAPQLAQPLVEPARCRLEAIALVVGADVLDRRDAEDDVERAVRERQRTDVRDDAAQAGHLRLGEVDADELGRAEADEAGEVDRLGKGVADVEHARLAAVAREAPRDLDRPLVASAGPAQLARALPGAPGPGCERDCIIEQAHARELVRGDEVGEQCGPRQRRPGDAGRRLGQHLRLGLPAKGEPVKAAHELLGRDGCELELRAEARVHRAIVCKVFA